MIKGEYYLAKLNENHYQDDLQKCIEETCQYCIDMNVSSNTDGVNDKKNNPIMMFGKIQSGKTRAYTGLMALAFDNQFDMVRWNRVKCLNNQAAKKIDQFSKQRKLFWFTIP